MKLFLVLVLFLQVAPAHALHRPPHPHRTSILQGTVSEPVKPALNEAWKLGLLGLAALGFLIRKRL